MQDYKRPFFNRQLSWDGVAMIGSIVAICIWIGSLKATVEQHTQQIASMQQTMIEIEHNQSTTSQQIAALLQAQADHYMSK